MAEETIDEQAEGPVERCPDCEEEPVARCDCPERLGLAHRHLRCAQGHKWTEDGYRTEWDIHRRRPF